MVVLYGLLAGLLVGHVRGGSLAGFGDLRLTRPEVAVCGLAVQVVLFLPVVAEHAGAVGMAVYVASTLAVLSFVLVNLRVPGMPLIALGAGANLAAILANGGVMPVDPVAAAAVGHAPTLSFTNAVIQADPQLRPLTDLIALPAWLPFSNVVSMGDVAITVGLAFAVQAAMSLRPAAAAPRHRAALAHRCAGTPPSNDRPQGTSGLLSPRQPITRFESAPQDAIARPTDTVDPPQGR
ncbi:MAG TPA: DUF5317 domain-containing protein [Candidatus Limnocylindrales bacterium]|jgi:hypothetical protein|nr:DUF5317 domain-containing protein [Candidatus Limnocylindrales bacterium]